MLVRWGKQSNEPTDKVNFHNDGRCHFCVYKNLVFQNTGHCLSLAPGYKHVYNIASIQLIVKIIQSFHLDFSVCQIIQNRLGQTHYLPLGDQFFPEDIND